LPTGFRHVKIFIDLVTPQPGSAAASGTIDDMASKSRTSALKQKLEASKRLREKRKAERAALKRQRRYGRSEGPPIASQEELEDLGLLAPHPGRKPKLFGFEEEQVNLEEALNLEDFGGAGDLGDLEDQDFR
jgi:hypothetical protein